MTWVLVFVITMMALLVILAAVVLWDCVSLALSEAEAPDARVGGCWCLHPIGHQHRFP
jgi:hypothetical protein